MWQTLIHIPHQWQGIPLFGWGWALILWSVISVVLITTAASASSLPRALREWAPFIVFVALLIIFVLPMIEVPARADDGTIVPNGIAIRGYGVMMGISIAAAVALAIYRAQRRGISVDIMLGMATWLVLLGIGGGRLFYLLQYWDDFRQPNLLATLGNALNLTQGGLVVYGAFFGGLAAFAFYVWRHKLSFLSMADLVVPSLMLGLALGRVGCFLNGCCYGGPTDHAWGVRFPPESVPYVEHLRGGRMHGFRLSKNADGHVIVTNVGEGGAAAAAGLPNGARILSIHGFELDSQAARDKLELPDHQPIDESVIAQLLIEYRPNPLRLGTDQGQFTLQASPLPPRTEPIHPTQIYSAITAGLMCLFLLAVEPFLPGKGALAAMWVTVYPPARFLLEIIRTDEGSFAGTGLTISQNVSLAMGLVAACFWIYLWRRNRQGIVKLHPHN